MRSLIGKTARITLWLVLVLFQESFGGDLNCKLIGIKGSNIEVEVENRSSKNLIMMGGSKDELVKLGVAFVGVNGNHIETIALGRQLAAYEMPDLIYLPAGYKRVFKFEIKKDSNQINILHIAFFINYLAEVDLKKKLDKDPSWNFVWDEMAVNLIFKKPEIEKFKQYYSFGSGMPGFGIEDKEKSKAIN